MVLVAYLKDLNGYGCWRSGPSKKRCNNDGLAEEGERLDKEQLLSGWGLDCWLITLLGAWKA